LFEIEIRNRNRYRYRVEPGPKTELNRFRSRFRFRLTTPNLHVGRQEGGATAFIQTSTGAIVEIGQELPIENVKSGRINWRSD
jgi:hypothetical protein